MSDGATRIDTWLWRARFFKSRTRAARPVAGGLVRVDRERVAKTHGAVRPGDVPTFPRGRAIRVVKVVRLGHGRGPATEAAALYEDLAPPPAADAEPAPARRERGGGRPTKADRRAMDRFARRPDAL